jgi:antitoxin VapB
VEISRRGREVVLQAPKRSLAQAFEALAAMPDDFMADGRQDQKPQNRRAL